MNFVLDVRWPITTPRCVLLDHQYVLLAALSRLIPRIHNEKAIGVHSIQGVLCAPGRLELQPTSSLTVRTPVEFLPSLIPLSGKLLDLGGEKIRLGSPTLLTLTPSPQLRTRIVTIKGYIEPADFSGAVRRQLDTLGVGRSVRVDVGSRRVVRVKRQTIVGFEVALEQLSDQESLNIQAVGLGGRRHLGCGLFVAVKPSVTKLTPED
jgi:CRISPR-associated protein Cas6